jgi:hypothetical protein
MNRKVGALVSRERLVLDGIAYNINVYMKGGTYRVVWYCGACSEQAKVAFEDATVQTAVEACKVNLAAHHTKIHAPS